MTMSLNPTGMWMTSLAFPVVFRVEVTRHASPISIGKSKSSSGGRFTVVTLPEAVRGRTPKSGRFAVPVPTNVSFVFTSARSLRSFQAYPRTEFEASV